MFQVTVKLLSENFKMNNSAERVAMEAIWGMIIEAGSVMTLRYRWSKTVVGIGCWIQMGHVRTLCVVGEL